MENPAHPFRLGACLGVALVAAGLGLALAQPAIRQPANARLVPGSLLVASEDLRDPNFAETVVLLIDYSDTGAVGVVINDLLDVPVTDVFPGIEELAGSSDRAHYGGPVAMNQAIVLLRSPGEPEGGDHVFDDVWVAGNQASLRHAAGDENESYRIYLGHAGWAPGQLDAELAQDGWHVFPGDSSLIFDSEPDEVWPDLIRRSRTVLAQATAARRPSGPTS